LDRHVAFTGNPAIDLVYFVTPEFSAYLPDERPVFVTTSALLTCDA
jgi:hypothetical protein